ncbi:hypothetical protein F0L74_20590 [Chitinophaga agrisoli]|uniref:Uncharacterized protein n=1 Tax=Chitinophaga agrisoli TaxID=2607653 RepID=A0A5B2VI87_9BACT|nr:hypothetical protein [Chitinophaga agrisoli]KAA2238625.1 hypothetical protein F0L74_20590 [Chitinophaga agrisoli]
MKNNVNSFMKKLKENPDGTISGGFGAIRGGFSLNPFTVNEACDNSKTCSGTNTGGCTNCGTCSGTTNSGTQCNNTGTCFA